MLQPINTMTYDFQTLRKPGCVDEDKTRTIHLFGLAFAPAKHTPIVDKEEALHV